MIDQLQASPAKQSLIVGVLMYLPFSMKIIFAFISDGLPILGQRYATLPRSRSRSRSCSG